MISGCIENVTSPIPAMPVNFRIDLTGKYNYLKNSSNQFAVIEKAVLTDDRIGYAGLLVYSGITLDDYGNSVYYVFDMACTNEVSKNAKVYPVSDEIGKVKCSKCGSVFDVSLGLGHPVSGPAKDILRKYKVRITDNYLYIYR